MNDSSHHTDLVFTPELVEVLAENQVVFQDKPFKRLEAIVKLEAITPNSWNPNEMPPAEFDSLKASLKSIGNNSLQSIIIRPCANREDAPDYEIVDGFHRYKAMQELGMTHAHCQIIDFPDGLARIYTIAMNKNRGEFDTLKLANLLAELKNNFGFDTAALEVELGYSEEELDALLSMTEVDLDSLQTEEQVPVIDPDEEALLLNQELTFNLTPEQKSAIETALHETKEPNQAEALTLICKDYLVSKGISLPNTPASPAPDAPTADVDQPKADAEQPKAEAEAVTQPNTADTEPIPEENIATAPQEVVIEEPKPDTPAA